MRTEKIHFVLVLSHYLLWEWQFILILFFLHILVTLVANDTEVLHFSIT